jgi:adenosine kinase
MATAGLDFDDYRIWLDENGVDTSLVNVIPDKYTASFFANTDLSNSQIASFYTGAMANASELSILDIPKKPDLVIISPNDPLAMEKYVEECLEEQIPYVYDPSQQIVRMDPKVLTRGVLGAYSVFVNAYELELLQKHTGLSCDEIVKKINFLVVTRGDCGASVFADGIEHPIDCVKPEKIVDPTGVGDAFRGGFIRGWRLGLEWTTCGQMGSLAATYCLEQSGTQNHHFSIREFIQRYRQNFNDQDALDILINRN